MKEIKESKLDILVCEIIVWDLDDAKQPMRMSTNRIVINEVASVEINESWKSLIDTAVVKFPRGTVLRRTLLPDGTDKQVYTERMNNGAIVEARDGYSIATTSDFAVGKRIRIRLGYTPDIQDSTSNLRTLFDGYIVKCSVSTPLEIRCENLASRLKEITCPNAETSVKSTVNEVLLSKSEGGKYCLLEGTGFSLYPATKESKISIGRISLTNDQTVADVLNSWSKMQLYCFLKYDNEGDMPRIAVGRSYFSNKSSESILNNTPATPQRILFDYHVANDNLTLLNTNPKFLAVEATSMNAKGKFYKITIRLNPEYDAGTISGDKAKKFQLLNETTLSPKERKLGASMKTKDKTKVNLETYTVVPYMSRKIDISNDELIREAQAFFESYNMNGIEGSLTLFGDLALRSGTKVELIDEREPEKNGVYLVEEVTTSFGVTGYRQTIKLPYKISKSNTEYGK